MSADGRDEGRNWEIRRQANGNGRLTFFFLVNELLTPAGQSQLPERLRRRLPLAVKIEYVSATTTLAETETPEKLRGDSQRWQKALATMHGKQVEQVLPISPERYEREFKLMVGEQDKRKVHEAFEKI